MKFSKSLVKSKFWVLFVILFLIVSFALSLWDFFTLRKLWYFFDIGSDTINLFFPQLIHNANVEKNGLWHWWSFYIGMGQVFPTYLILELSNLIFNHYVFFWTNAWIYSFHILYFGEVLLSAIVMYFYFRQIGLRPEVSLLGAVLWQFSGYMVVGMAWYIFPYFLFAGSLILLGTEQLIKDKNPIWFIYGVYLLSINLYFLITYAIFFVIYLATRFDYEKVNFKQVKNFLVKAVVYGLLALLANLVNIIPRWSQIINSPRVSGDVSMFSQLWHHPEPFSGSLRVSTSILRFFGNDLAGTALQWQGWFNYLEAPLFYVGLISLLLVPVFFALADKRKKWLYGGFLGFWLLVAFIPQLRHAINLYAGNYFRGTIDFFVSFTLLWIAMQGLDLLIKKSKLSLGMLILSLALLIGMMLFAINLGGIKLNKPLVIITVGFLIAESYFLYLLTTDYKQFAFIAIILIASIEAGYMTHFSMKNRWSADKAQFIRNWGGYKDNTIAALAIIHKKDSNPFFRIEKDYSSGKAIHASINDNLVQDYYSTVSYNSFNQLNYIRFLEAIGSVRKGAEAQTRWAHGVRSMPLMMTYAGVKYFLTKNSNSPLRSVGFDSIGVVGDVMILRNKYALPLAFTKKQILREDDFFKLNNFKRQQSLLSTTVLNSDDYKRLTRFKELDTNTLATEKKFNFQLYRKLVNNLTVDKINLVSFAQDKIVLKIKTSEPKILILTIPFDKSWKIYDNGRQLKTMRVDIGMLGTVISPGEHTVQIKFRTPFYFGSLIISIIALILIILTIFFAKKFKLTTTKNK